MHLAAANNSKVPVTLQLSQHDDGDHIQHVMRVSEIHRSIHFRGSVTGVRALYVRGVTECGQGGAGLVCLWMVVVLLSGPSFLPPLLSGTRVSPLI